MKKSPENAQTPAEFAQEHWKEIAAISGTMAGAAILLLIRYYKKRKAESGDQSVDQELDQYEDEATGNTKETPMLLETGIPVAKHIEDSESLTAQLAEGLEGRAKSFMRTLGHLRNSR